MKKKLFWLEDDALLGRIFTRALEPTEFELIQAKTGREAVDKLKNIVPDVIMVDLLVPGELDGFGVLAEIANDERLKKVPKIVLSNLSSQEDIDHAKSLGADTFIVKASSSIDLILGQVRATLGK